MRAIGWIVGGVGLAAVLLLWSRKSSASISDGGVDSTLLQDVLTVVGPRGIRNNNPGNIRLTTDAWRGMAAEQTDGVFVQFIAPEYGIRAMAVILSGYRKVGRKSIRKIINRWAPPSENNTDAYVQSVATALGVDPDQDLTDAQIPALIGAIIKHENGVQPYDVALLEEGANLA